MKTYDVAVYEMREYGQDHNEFVFMGTLARGNGYAWCPAEELNGMIDIIHIEAMYDPTVKAVRRFLQ